VTSLSRYVHAIGVKVCVLLSVACAAMSANGQDAPNPVGDFLSAFRGKPVGAVAPPPVGTPASPQASSVNTSRASTTATQSDVPANTPSCPEGTDRAGCFNSLGQRARNDCPAGMAAGPTGCVPTAMPPNAHRISADGQWQCDDGYMRFGAVCMAIQSTPANAHLTGIGTNWECNTGFRRTGNTCVAVAIPPNAHFANTWTGWECDSGYRMVGSWCVAH